MDVSARALARIECGILEKRSQRAALPLLRTVNVVVVVVTIIESITHVADLLRLHLPSQAMRREETNRRLREVLEAVVIVLVPSVLDSLKINRNNNNVVDLVVETVARHQRLATSPPLMLAQRA